jgi:S-adenosyl methyltransferase
VNAANRVYPARIYDYWLTGTEITPADKESAKWALKIVPEFHDYAVGNNKFLARAMRFLLDAGIRQFLEIGARFPATPNVHEIAQAADPASRVVYVGDDELAFRRTTELLDGNLGATAVKADPRDVDAVVDRAAELLDLTLPMAILFVAFLHHLDDADDPAGLVGRYLKAAAPGSHLVLSHSTQEMAPARMKLGSELARRMAGLVFVPRRRDPVLRMFNGRDLVEPGLVQVSYWRPDGEPEANADRVWALGGIARLLPRRTCQSRHARAHRHDQSSRVGKCAESSWPAGPDPGCSPPPVRYPSSYSQSSTSR